MRKTKVLSLSGDKKGLIVERNGVSWHVHSDEMTARQKRIHTELLKQGKSRL